MTDTATDAAPTNSPSVSLDISMLEGIAQRIALIDEQLAGISGSEAAMRKSVVARIHSENSDTIKGVTDKLVEQFDRLKQNPVLLVGVIEVLPDVLAEAFAGYISEVIDEQVKKLSEGSKDKAGPLREERKAQVEQFKAMKTVLEQFKVDTSSVPLPKRAGGRSGGGTTGSTAQRTGNNPEGYRYYVDGKRQPVTQNTFSSLAYYGTLGCVKATDEDPDKRAEHQKALDEKPERWSAQELRDYMTANYPDLKLGKPGEGDDTWEIGPLPNGKKLSARRLDPIEDKDIFDKVAEVEAAKANEADSDGDGSDSEPETQTPAPAAV